MSSLKGMKAMNDAAIYDVIIIGAGPAGISASLYTLRAGLSTLIIGKDGGALEQTDKIENYFGTGGVISGKELLKLGRQQTETLGGTFLNEEVVAVEWLDLFKVSTPINILHSKAVIIAAGSKRNSAKIKGIERLEGKGVSYCAVCDAFFYRGKDVAVLGSGEYALHEASALKDIVNSITLFTDGKEPGAAFPQDIKIITTPVEEIEGDERVSSVKTKDGNRYTADGVFVALGTAGAGEFAKKLGLPTENSRIIVNPDKSTMIPGIFAAGDCIGGVLQIATAVGEGAEAALSAIKYIKSLK